MTEPEAALLNRCRAGDKEAFGQLVKRYAAAAQGAARILLGNHEDALDASQDAFVRDFVTAWAKVMDLDRFDL